MSARLTVLLDGDPLAPQQARLGAALARRGHRAVVLDAPKVAAQIREEHGERCEEASLPRRGPAILRRFLTGRLVRSLGVDVVHLNYLAPRHELWARLAGGPPYVATAWGSDLNEEAYPKSLEHKASVARVLAGASAVTADSVPLLAKARAHARPGVRAEIVLWGVDRAQFDPDKARAGAARMRGELGVEPGRRVVLSPRQTRADYHIERIVRAFAASRYRREGGVLVVKLHGRRDEAAHEAALIEIAREAGADGCLRFARRCAYADLPALYAVADAAVSIPEADGVPSTYCELLALGVPIVANDLPAYEGVLEHDDRSLLVPPGDEAALTAALDRLATEPGLAARLAARGQAWAAEHADWERCVDRFVSLYEAAVAASS